MLLLGLVAAFLLTGLLYQAAADWLDQKRFPPCGQMIAVDGCRIHLNRQGMGGPAVVLESGIAASSLSWLLVQPALAEWTTVCSYDRAGLGWSTGPKASSSPEQAAARLLKTLEQAGVAPPYILAGHSFGGLLIGAFAHLYPHLVQGLVFVDPVSIHTWAHFSPSNHKRLKRGVSLSRRGALLARFGIVRATLAVLANGGRWLPKLMAKATAHQGAALMTRLVGEVRKLPPSAWPVVRAHWSRPKAFEAMANHLEALPSSATAAAAMTIPRALPIIILSAADATDQEIKERDTWVHHSIRGQHTRVLGAGHWLHLERPELVIAAIRELL